MFYLIGMKASFSAAAFREVPLAERSVLGTVQLAFDSEVNGPSTQPTVDQKCMNFMAEHDHKDKAAHSMFLFPCHAPKTTLSEESLKCFFSACDKKTSGLKEYRT